MTIAATDVVPTPHAGVGSVVVALAQMAPRLGDLATNLSTHMRVVDQAQQGGAHLVVFPELSLTGYFLKDITYDVALRADAPELRALAAACTDVDAVVGCVLEDDANRFFNAAIYLGSGRIQHIHRKLYLPTYGLFDEQRFLARGETVQTFVAPLDGARQARPWRAGILVCEDLWHPSNVTLLSRQGMDVLIAVSASPGRGVHPSTTAGTLGTAASYDAMTRTYAALLTSYVIYCNRVGYEDGVAFWGGSRVVGPDGVPLGPPAGSDDTLLWCKLDLGAIRRARIATPLLRDERHDLIDRESHRLRRRDRG